MSAFRLEIRLLLFLTSVVILATSTFFCGGACAAWQWWIPLVGVAALGRWRTDWRASLRGTLLFLAVVFVAWILCGVSVAPAWWDEGVYHIPMVRMLEDGWNPIEVRTPEALQALFGLEPTEVRMLHIVFAAKIVWIFNAVAFFFTRDVLHPMLPVLCFLWPAVVCRTFRSMKGAAWWWRIAAIGILVCIVPNTPCVPDAVLALSAIGLFLAFEEILSERGFDPAALVLYSFWLMGSKTNGMMHGIVFWSVFMVCLAFKHRQCFRRCLAAGVVTATMLLFANATPYLTSWYDYGHPLYPRYTVDEERFPSTNITEDFVVDRNEDAAAMSHLGLFVNAYISPTLARLWYAWRLDKPDFRVWSAVYFHYPGGDLTRQSPVRLGMRMAFWLSVLVLLLSRRRSFRPIVVMVFVGIAAVPTPMVGYIRYVPWWLSVSLFAMMSLLEEAESSGGGRRKSLFAAAALLTANVYAIRPWHLGQRLFLEFGRFEDRRELVRIIETEDLSDGICPPRAPLANGSQLWYGEFKLMKRMFPRLDEAKVVHLPVETSQKLWSEVHPPWHLQLPGAFFAFADLDRMQSLMERRESPGHGSKSLKMLHSIFVALPKSVIDRMVGRPTFDRE